MQAGPPAPWGSGGGVEGRATVRQGRGEDRWQPHWGAAGGGAGGTLVYGRGKWSTHEARWKTVRGMQQIPVTSISEVYQHTLESLMLL